MNDPLFRGAKIVYPAAVDENDQHTITELEPRQQGNFPDPTRFPPCPSWKEKGSCGCLLTTHDDAGQGQIKLETIWQPLWDTQLIEQGKDTLFFFQNPNGRGTEKTNVPTAGQLSWPKRFHLWEVSLHFKKAHVLQFVKDHGEVLKNFFEARLNNDFSMTVRIGEKHHLQMPLGAMYNPTPGQYRAAICTPLYLPPVQNFSVILNWRAFRDEGLIHSCRAVMHGYLHREIQ